MIDKQCIPWTEGIFYGILSGPTVFSSGCQEGGPLEGGPLVWMLPLYLHVNQKSDYDDDMMSHHTI